MSEPLKLKVGSAERPLPRWVLGPLGVLAILGVLGAMAWFAWSHVDADKARISPADLVQLEHSNRHLTETPAAVTPVFEDAHGKLLVKFYASDSCMLVERHAPNGPVSARFMLDLDMQTPLRFAAHSHLAEQPPLPFETSAAEAQGRCYPGPADHPGAPAVRYEGKGPCSTLNWRTWPDGCEGYAEWNGCASVWGRWVWTHCVH